MLFEPRQLLLDRALARLAIDFADLADILDDVHPRLLSRIAPSYARAQSVNLQWLGEAPRRECAMVSWLPARSGRKAAISRG